MDVIEESLECAAFHYRVSTHSQDIQMQYDAAEKHKSLYHDYQIFEFKEVGVSSNKIRMDKRPEFLKLLNLIKSGKIQTLYVYDRSRITRKFYEYIEFLWELKENKVSLIFTTDDPNYSRYTGDVLMECIQAIFIEEEAKNIARRITDYNTKKPNNKFGYSVKKDINNTTYSINETHKEGINSYFSSLLNVKNLEDLCIAIQNHKKFFSNKQLDYMLKVATDPFYAGYEFSHNSYNELTYVNPYISLEEHKTIKGIIEPLLEKMDLNRIKATRPLPISIICNYCGKEMQYEVNNFDGKSVYKCSCKIKHVIGLEDLGDFIKNSCEIIVKKFDTSRLENEVIKNVKKEFSNITKELEQVKRKVWELEFDLMIKDLSTISQKEKRYYTNLLYEANKSKIILELKVDHCKLTLNSLHELISIIKSDLKKLFSSLEYTPFLISKLYVVNSNEVEVEFYFSDYIEATNEIIIHGVGE
ncbi:MAG: hypothetical protein K0S34_35 [Bacillales bacterium]|nr:hypothetical protein [Bacillales bacterium]